VLRPACIPVEVEDVLAGALDMLGQAAHRVHVDVDPGLPALLADPGLLERVLANLLANALAWAPPDDNVRFAAVRTGASIAVRISDRGPGIPIELRSRVFDPFQRLGDRSSQAGVGLGLAVARGFVAAMGGGLELDDTPGGGLTAIVTLPAVAE
jgi:two-component system sensor histidine kinase KdpD